MLSASLQRQQKRLYQISYRSSNLTRHLLPLQSSDKFDINVAIIRSVTRTLRKATASLPSPRFLLKGRVHVCRVRSHRHKMSHARGQCLCHSLTELRQSLEECKFEISLGIKLPWPGVCKQNPVDFRTKPAQCFRGKKNKNKNTRYEIQRDKSLCHAVLPVFKRQKLKFK